MLVSEGCDAKNNGTRLFHCLQILRAHFLRQMQQKNKIGNRVSVFSSSICCNIKLRLYILTYIFKKQKTCRDMQFLPARCVFYQRTKKNGAVRERESGFSNEWIKA